MRKLVYSTSLSLDGYIDPAAGDPSWVVPDEELHRHFNEVEREAGLIDEYRLYYVPIFLGSGKATFSQIQNSVRLKRSRHSVVCIFTLPNNSLQQSR